MGEIILLLFPPAQDSRLIEHSTLLRFVLVDLLPLRNTGLSGSIRAAASRHSILQHPRRMSKEPVVFCTLCPSVESYLGLMDG